MWRRNNDRRNGGEWRRGLENDVAFSCHGDWALPAEIDFALQPPARSDENEGERERDRNGSIDSADR